MTLNTLENYSYDDWKQAADRARRSLNTKHFIGGDFIASSDDARFGSTNPANDILIAEIAAAGPRDVDHAVATAKAAFKGGTWRLMAPRDKMDVMYRWSDLVLENAERLAVLDTLEMGKPIADMLAIDLPSVAGYIRFCGEVIDKIEGRVTNTESDALHYVAREPLGVVAAISPWNYPMLMAIWKVAPALAAGNAVVLKPAEQATLSCLELARLFVEAGGPAGVFNVIGGIGEVAGKALAMHNDVAKVSFTGSTAVGKLMLQYAGLSNLKQVALECGGKSPQIFMADLTDMETAVSAAYNGIYGNMGEVCNAASRILVQKPIYEEFVARFKLEGKSAYKAGDPLDPETSMGPLVTRAAQTRVLSLIESGRREGATLEFGGDVPKGFECGAYVSPTLFSGVNNQMQIAREEIFGPVACIIPFESMEDAIEIANDTPYGLAAGIWSGNINTAHKLVKAIDAGVVWVNTFDDGDFTMPFGGFKQSGNAKDNCMQSVLSYTREKAAWFRFS